MGPNGEITTYASSREEEDARKAYLERWVRRHVVADKVEGEGEWETMDGEVVSMRAEGDSWKVGPGDLDVKDVVQVRSRAVCGWEGRADERVSTDAQRGVGVYRRNTRFGRRVGGGATRRRCWCRAVGAVVSCGYSCTEAVCLDRSCGGGLPAGGEGLPALFLHCS